MKKNILFRKLFTLSVALMSLSCFSFRGDLTTIATISLTNFDCIDENKNDDDKTKYLDCHNEIDNIMSSIRGIKEYDSWIDATHNHKIILINIVYNHKVTSIDIITKKIESHEYTVKLEMQE